MPVLSAATEKSVMMAPIWLSTVAGFSTCTALTTCVFCAVTAVMAQTPYTPCAAKVLRSA